jgi:hypothetical protein
MSELDTSGSVEGLGRATSPVYSTTLARLPFLDTSPVKVAAARDRPPDTWWYIQSEKGRHS